MKIFHECFFRCKIRNLVFNIFLRTFFWSQFGEQRCSLPIFVVNESIFRIFLNFLRNMLHKRHDMVSAFSKCSPKHFPKMFTLSKSEKSVLRKKCILSEKCLPYLKRFTLVSKFQKYSRLSLKNQRKNVANGIPKPKKLPPAACCLHNSTLRIM